MNDDEIARAVRDLVEEFTAIADTPQDYLTMAQAWINDPRHNNLGDVDIALFCTAFAVGYRNMCAERNIPVANDPLQDRADALMKRDN